MIKIGFAGAPGVGKTTVAQCFCAELRYLTQKRVELIDEYARSFVSKFGEASISDQYLLAHKQIDKEASFPKAEYLVTDAPAFLTMVYTYLNIDWKNPKDKHFLKEIYCLLVDSFHSYDFIFCSNPLPETKDDGVRIHIDNAIVTKI